uniref:AlNc14C303G10400 protein n=1 Tax=Albugo laibachii Nc14 TaxID=890382 RepID=F0WVR1_9STRA|nr:AlNc14C303G10400 [Albugo laibachii Nc14]|eukprot:CCA25507.1 AlNc14C303G10400 [Albugo laibachii Nc14]
MATMTVTTESEGTHSSSLSNTAIDVESEKNDSAEEYEERPMIEITQPIAMDDKQVAERELPPIEIAFTASAGCFVYQMGIAAYLQEHFLLSDCHFSGCSGGAWTATLLASGTDVREAWRVMREATVKCFKKARWYSGYGKIANAIVESVFNLWEDDGPAVLQRIQERNLSIVATEFPSMKAEQFTQWDSVEDLANSIIASALVPFALTGRPFLSLHGKWYIDGAFSNFKGVKCEKYNTWADLWFHSSQLVCDVVHNNAEKLSTYCGGWTKCINSVLDQFLPRQINSPHPAIAPHIELSRRSSKCLDLDIEQHPRQLIVRPWQWRRQTITSFHLSANIDAHNTRFEQGYDDAKLHHHELAHLLQAKDTCGQGA